MDKKEHPNNSKEENTESLRNRMVNAGGWVAGGFIFSQLLRFGSNLILTRLLIPDMFGLMAVVTVIQMGLAMFSDVGLLQNIVQSPRGKESSFLNTAWLVQILRGCLLFLIMLLVSWLLVVAGDAGLLGKGVYSDPLLPDVLAVMSFNVLISGFSSTKLLTASREMLLMRVSFLELGCQFAGTIVMVIMAWINPTIWVLVIGSMIASTLNTLLSHFVIPGSCNRFEWDTSAFHEIFHFGKWIFLASIFGFLVNQGDRLLLGGLISSEMLGFYTIAFFLANALKLILMKINGLVFFPALSEVARERPYDMAGVYYKIRLRVDCITYILAGFLLVSGQSIIDILYDSRYSESGWMLEVLSISLMGTGLLVAGQCFLALGKARLLSFLIVIQALILFTMLPLMFGIFGIHGAIYVIALFPVLSGVVGWWFMYKLGLLDLRRELVMLPVVFVGVVSGEVFNYILS